MEKLSDGHGVGKVFQVRVPPGQSDQPREGDLDEEILRFESEDGSYFMEDSAFEAARQAGLELEVIREIDESEIPVRFFPSEQGVIFDPPPDDARLAVLARLLAEDRAQGDEHVRFIGRNCTVPTDGFALDRAGGHRCYVWQVIPAHEALQPSILADRVPRLLALLTDPGARVALSLGSGGLKLFAHATAFRLLEELGVDESIDEVWGSSAGAVAGLLYSHGLSPEAIEKTGYDLYAGRYDLSLQPSKSQLLRQLLRETLLPSKQPSHAGFVDCTESLARMLDRYCATFRPRRSLYCIAFNLADCRPEVLTPDPVPPHLEGLMVQTDALEAALASSAVPLLMIPRLLRRGDREVPYVDGSATEEVPLHSVVRKWDLDREAGVETRERLVVLYVKLTGTLAIYRTKHGRISKLRLLQTIASAGMETMHQRDVALALERPDVEPLSLQLPGSSPDFFEVRRIPEFIRLAREVFCEQLLEIEEKLSRS
jgi:hypothetical protein